jgi:osmotically-inducible protein OsmY
MKMPHQLTGKRAALVLALLLSSATGALAVTTPRANARHAHAKTTAKAAAPNCASVTDAQIVAMIKHKIRTTPSLNKTRKNIDVISKDHEVTLDGCTLKSAGIVLLVKYAKGLHCVTTVNNNLRVCGITACLPGQQKCADGQCISKGAMCPPPPKPK